MRMALLYSLLVVAGCGGSPMSVETRSSVDRAEAKAAQQAEFRKRECFRQGSRCAPEGAGEL